MTDGEFKREAERLKTRFETLGLSNFDDCLITSDTFAAGTQSENILRHHRLIHKYFRDTRFAISFTVSEVEYGTLPAVFEKSEPTFPEIDEANISLHKQLKLTSGVAANCPIICFRGKSENTVMLIGTESFKLLEKATLAVHGALKDAARLAQLRKKFIDYAGVRGSEIAEEIIRMNEGSVYMKSRDSRQSEIK